jgi:hypothetical protein
MGEVPRRVDARDTSDRIWRRFAISSPRPFPPGSRFRLVWLGGPSRPAAAEGSVSIAQPVARDTVTVPVERADAASVEVESRLGA